ncbi:MAG: PTS sugar transporter subunit IIA [Candidatus Sumerlaeia bacterium]
MNLTLDDVIRLFGVSEKTIQRWIRAGGLPACRINQQYRFNRSDLLEWASVHQISIVPVEDGRTAAASMLADALEAGGIHTHVPGTDKASVLATVVERLKLPEPVDRAGLLNILMTREEMGSTAIGDGIAIPHPRNPIVLGVPEPSVSLCLLEQPIEFGALDGRPVGVLFTLISPTVPAHLAMLSRLMFVLRDQALKELLQSQASADRILSEVRRVEAALNTPTETAC